MPPRQRLAETAARLDPYRQGQLDSLCGLYAIVNAVRLLLEPIWPLQRRHARKLFLAGVEHLARRRKLAAVLDVGMTPTTWLRLLYAMLEEAAAVSGVLISAVPLLADEPGPDIGRALGKIERSIARGRPVLLTLFGGWDHTSVVVGVSEHQLRLFDSFGFHHVNVANVGIHGSGSKARHQLVAAMLIALRVPP